jgi:DNA recombination protein RmuC
VDAYNKSVTTLEPRVLVSARRLRELKAASETVDIESIEPVERVRTGGAGDRVCGGCTHWTWGPLPCTARRAD